VDEGGTQGAHHPFYCWDWPGKWVVVIWSYRKLMA
jgi:hypothetical protein